MLKKEPTPSAKCDISLDQASKFLSGHYSNGVKNVTELHGGKHSKAFSYENAGQNLIIRFNTENRGFLKDAYAFEHFSKQIPLAKIVDSGTYQKNIYFCITEKIHGETARDQYNRKDFSSLSLLYSTVEKIAEIKMPGTGFGYLGPDNNAAYKSSLEYIKSVYRSKDLFDWNEIYKIPFVDKKFTDYVAEKMEHYSQYTTEQRELLHGDFGADNVFIADGAVSGVIDWEKMRSGDHFLDIGRVLLFCPNKQATTSEAIKFYENSGIKNWKERAAMGIYHVVLTNYAYAAMGGNEASCKSSETRLKELEQGLGLN